jgi:hypothetical protein
MKVIGLEISGREVRIITLDNTTGVIENCTKKYKPIKLEDDEDARNVLLFKNTLFATLDSFSPDVIVFNYRNPNASGKYAPSAISFKIEGLIQLYENAKIHSTKSQTLAAYYKKNKIDISTDFNYQLIALKLAYHYIKTN